jgi:hypothetical protein
LERDRLNCGSCARKCPAGSICTRGACEVSCARPLRVCGNQCTAVLLDPKNCGACGNVCKGDAICRYGKCVTPKPGPGL